MPFVDSIGRTSKLIVLIVGEQPLGSTLAEGLANESTSRIWTLEPPAAADDPGSSAALARALSEFEADVTSQEVTEIVLADDSDSALAAALVATKLLIPVTAHAAARDPSSTNGHLIAQLVGSYTRPA
jgi:hypothetical protein